MTDIWSKDFLQLDIAFRIKDILIVGNEFLNP